MSETGFFFYLFSIAYTIPNVVGLVQKRIFWHDCLAQTTVTTNHIHIRIASIIFTLSSSEPWIGVKDSVPRKPKLLYKCYVHTHMFEMNISTAGIVILVHIRNRSIKCTQWYMNLTISQERVRSTNYFCPVTKIHFLYLTSYFFVIVTNIIVQSKRYFLKVAVFKGPQGTNQKRQANCFSEKHVKDPPCRTYVGQMNKSPANPLQMCSDKLHHLWSQK